MIKKKRRKKNARLLLYPKKMYICGVKKKGSEMEDELGNITVVTRAEVLRRAKLIMEERCASGLCYAIRMALVERGVVIDGRDIEDFFHLYKHKYAMLFFARRNEGFWWRSWSFGIFSGRRMFLNWLIWKYRDDETNLLDL